MVSSSIMVISSKFNPLINRYNSWYVYPNIRIKANIFKTAQEFSDAHYLGRSVNKNALAHSSSQSSYVESYGSVVDAYNRALADDNLLSKRPHYWGGFSFKPYYFEFWQGAEHRLNKRDIYKIENNDWKHSMLQP